MLNKDYWMKRFGGFLPMKVLLSINSFYVFCVLFISAQFTVEVKHLSDLQSNHGSNMKKFHKLLRHCNVPYSSTSYAQSISNPYFLSRFIICIIFIIYIFAQHTDVTYIIEIYYLRDLFWKNPLSLLGADMMLSFMNFFF